MRAPLSIVIPTLNAEAHLPALLVALMEGVEAGIVRELIVSDGGSTDATQVIAEEVGAVWVTGPAGRGGQLGRGVSRAGGDWLLVLHADSAPGPGWVEAVERGIVRGGPGFFRLRFRVTGVGPRVTAGWANLRSRVLGMPFGDQGLLVSREAYEAAGGYPDIPLMEDMALIRALPRARLLDAWVETGWTRYAGNWIGRGAGNLVRQARFLAGTDPAKLARGYRRD
ncbi:glycosyltransferase [Maritimibacter sp. UBA3975]|uniref:glycosyltransferase n=1 Tax=Maritimibacter sp. UBA3975 TaxID=1946833 RepID=UPI000C098E3E|nr:glycosyltransferase [Maritimibacter sp. UBA3975]MAM61443.1 glycosyl transferase [Maritimibacter sp.]|tara:strand:- start:9509 stop:10183 length:675 start_codon:yes stop_codon:yes gene_type:complete